MVSVRLRYPIPPFTSQSWRSGVPRGDRLRRGVHPVLRLRLLHPPLVRERAQRAHQEDLEADDRALPYDVEKLPRVDYRKEKVPAGTGAR